MNNMYEIADFGSNYVKQNFIINYIAMQYKF